MGEEIKAKGSGDGRIGSEMERVKRKYEKTARRRGRKGERETADKSTGSHDLADANRLGLKEGI